MSDAKSKLSKKAAFEKEYQKAQIALANGTISYEEYLSELSLVQLKQHKR
jgi:hypothetical protein